MNRRRFTQKSLLAGSGLLLPWSGRSIQRSTDKIRIGICADIHQDIIHDAEGRIKVFINQMKSEEPDFIIQLGDFCHPIKDNKRFLKIWDEFEGSKHHVLGNHDMDLANKSETIKFWGMKDDYYSFDYKGFHFIILDANFIKKEGQSNFIDYANANFYLNHKERPWINDKQLLWLEKDLATSVLPTIVFSHQGLGNEKGGVVNKIEVQSILSNAKNSDESNKVLACINGHNHVDYHTEKKGIHYYDQFNVIFLGG